MKIITVVMPLYLLLFSCVDSPASDSRAEGSLDLAQQINMNGLWSLSRSQFQENYGGIGFRELSAADTTSLRIRREGLRLAGIPLVEAHARFSDDALSSLDFTAFSRGDSGLVSADDFEAILSGITQRIDRLTGVEGNQLQDERRSATARISRRVWVNEPLQFDLIWSYTLRAQERGVEIPFRPEFIRISLTEHDPSMRVWLMPGAHRPTTRQERITVFCLRERVERKPNGDVYLKDFPMVDQGDKGYCAAATAERILRYYNRDLDQHEVAQLANTSAEGGTSLDGMREALNRISRSAGVNSRSYFSIDYREYERILRRYNSTARSRRAGELSLERNANLLHFFSQMSPEILFEARGSSSADRNRFERNVRNHIDAGAPIVWSMIVGLAEEKPAIRPGVYGHMRIIIGYNARTDEILYTDSWGRGHEMKRMPLSQAWSVTVGYDSILPEGIRI